MMDSGSYEWKRACREKFIEKVGETLKQLHAGEVDEWDALDRIRYDYGDLVGDE